MAAKTKKKAAKAKSGSKGAARKAPATTSGKAKPAAAGKAPAAPAKSSAAKAPGSGIVYSDLRRELLAKRLLGL